MVDFRDVIAYNNAVQYHEENSAPIEKEDTDDDPR